MNPTIKNHKEKIIGYKAVEKDEKGYFTDGMRNSEKFYFEVGKTYSIKGEPVLCKNGIHFFRHYCFALDYLEEGNSICKIESLGDVQEDTEKCVTNKIKILEIGCKEEVDNNSNSGDKNSGKWNSGDKNSGNWNSGKGNSGDRNSGYGNSGKMNSGNWNSGDENSGERNSGKWNSGDGNSGKVNSGNYNSGDRNSGKMNSGYWNSGDENSGDGNSGNKNSGYKNSGNKNSGYWNSGNGNSGDGNSGNCNSGDRNSGDFNSGNGYRNYFCTQKKYFLFDKECSEEDVEVLNNLDMSWFDLNDKTYKKAWKSCPESVLKKIQKLKNFNSDRFYEITGIKVKTTD